VFVLEGLRCCRCGEIKPEEEFAWRRRRKLQRDTYCRPCRSVYGREHYLANRQHYIDQAKIVRQKQALERTRWLLAYFEEHPCTDCGVRDPLVLEFDHLRNKAFNIGEGFAERVWKTILEEIEKCEVVCANCHRRRTALRRGTLRALLSKAGVIGEAGDES
jgi:hypothetical protein